MGDRDGKVEPLSINTIPGKTAPRFDAHTTELTPLHATITERGMSSGWPMVDIVFVDPHDKRFGFTTSGRMMLMLAAAIQACVIRNGHEPDYVPVIIEALRGKHAQSDFMEHASNAIADEIRAKVAEKLGAQLDVIVPNATDFREAVQRALIDLLVK